MIELKDEELAEAVSKALEPSPPIISARKAREQTRGFEWSSCYDFISPKGWWKAEIGTDHGPVEADNDPVRWRSVFLRGGDMAVVWSVVEEMKNRGWLFHILACWDGWIVNARFYKLVDGKWDGEAMLTNEFVQEVGDEVDEAIYRAAVAACLIAQNI